MARVNQQLARITVTEFENMDKFNLKLNKYLSENRPPQ